MGLLDDVLTLLFGGQKSAPVENLLHRQTDREGLAGGCGRACCRRCGDRNGIWSGLHPAGGGGHERRTDSLTSREQADNAKQTESEQLAAAVRDSEDPDGREYGSAAGRPPSGTVRMECARSCRKRYHQRGALADVAVI